MGEILIRNMELPKTCRKCLEMEIPVRCRVKEQEAVTAVMIGYNRPDDCPLIELPPHGRLIDADIFIGVVGEVLSMKDADNVKEIVKKMMCEFAIETIKKSPTVIPASEGE